MTPWQIVPVSADTLGEAARLHALSFPEEAWNAEDFSGILAMAGASGHFIYGAAEGAAAGFLFDTMLGTAGEIVTLGVAPERRRQGAARALIDDLLRRARAQGVASLTLEVADDNRAALALYQAFGFEQVGFRPRYYHRADGREIDAKLLRVAVSA
jgi:[ribosomal protein S18]-alanine N-acetyltransferase